MTGASGRLVTLPASPDVQLLGDAAIIRGAAALDAYRLMSEGIRSVRRRDAIEPSRRLLQTVAVLKAAAEQAATTATGPSMSAPGHADVREGPIRGSLVSGQVAIGEAARMLGLGVRQTRRLAETGAISGRQTRPGRPWSISRASVQAYLVDHQETA